MRGVHAFAADRLARRPRILTLVSLAANTNLADACVVASARRSGKLGVLTRASPMRPITFEQQLWITILDKLLIALLIALAGFVLARALERFKAREARRTEYSKLRVIKIGEVWEALGDWEHARGEWVKQGNRVHERNDETNQKAAFEALKAEAEAEKRLELLLDRNRFWLGDRLASAVEVFKSEFNRSSILENLPERERIDRAIYRNDPEALAVVAEFYRNTYKVTTTKELRTRRATLESIMREVLESREL
jgi:hypothetical protein